MPKIKRERGITLVALIITIIVLILLAAVTIFAFTESGILQTTSKEAENYANIQRYEEEVIQIISDFADDVVRNITSIGGESNDGGGSGSDEGSNNPPKPENEPIEIADVGKYVYYKPNSGTYEKATLDQYSGSTGNSAFTTEEDLKWRIWNVDDKNLYLISEKETTQQLILTGSRGYNNGVTLLDEICNTCYKGNFTGISAKNLKVEDLEKVMEIPKDANYSTQPYPEFTGNAPYIWRQNESASWTASKNNKSTAYSLTTQTGSKAAMRPWYNTYASVALPAGTYKDIIKRGKYWLSSRFAYPGSSNHCFFGIHVVSSGTLFGKDSIEHGYLYHSYGNGYSPTASVRPLVTIPRDSFTGTWDEAHENLSIKPI